MTSMIPSQTILTNEVKLHDYKGTKLSITFGDADINEGYSYAKVNFRANDLKFDFFIDKPNLNFICDELTINDLKVWNELNHGPNSGLNADMLDGLHFFDFKDRAGRHHYLHMFNNPGGKKFVKIATFTPRRVGNAPNFNTNGTKPFEGIFSDLIMQDKIEEFKANTTSDLSSAGNAVFQTTDMLIEGIYNSTLRASISILKKNYATTADIHIGLFSQPSVTAIDGWSSLQKYFYISLHDEHLQYINENHDENTNLDPNKPPSIVTDGLSNVIESLKAAVNESSSESTVPYIPLCSHTPPGISKNGYTPPSDPTPDYIKPNPFAAKAHEGFSYSRYLDAFRLYHVESKKETIDGVEVISHRFDLYMAIDELAELHIQPYMSSGCFIYNFEKPITEANLPIGNFIRPKSIYDNRYAHKAHRHYGYEQKIWHLIEQVDEVWDAFDNYVTIEQGVANAKKILMTDNNGKVFPSIDNFERHNDARRAGRRALISSVGKCIEESIITQFELEQLDDVRSNVQKQIDDLLALLYQIEQSIRNDIPDVSNFVKRTGDTMSGYLSLHADPTHDMHAVNKRYVDDKTRDFVKKGGDTMTGFLTLHADPTSDMHAVTKRYVDTKIGDYVKKTGDTMTGDLKMNSAFVRFPGNGRDSYFFGGTSGVDIGAWNNSTGKGIWTYNSGDNALRLHDRTLIFGIAGAAGGSDGGRKLTIQPTEPSNPSNGDIWIKNY